jgi:hypothetical protein
MGSGILVPNFVRWNWNEGGTLGTSDTRFRCIVSVLECPSNNWRTHLGYPGMFSACHVLELKYKKYEIHVISLLFFSNESDVEMNCFGDIYQSTFQKLCSNTQLFMKRTKFYVQYRNGFIFLFSLNHCTPFLCGILAKLVVVDRMRQVTESWHHRSAVPINHLLQMLPLDLFSILPAEWSLA